MLASGLLKQPRRRGRVETAGTKAAEDRFDRLEVRSYEAEYVNALWHLDFHVGSLKVLLPDGTWAAPSLLGILDDCSRLGIHAQWYLRETADDLVHGLCQGFQKRDICGALMHDNGSAMVAGETVQGLVRLGVVQENTLPYSPYQNGKQEVFWGQVEGRLLPMLENCKDPTLPQINVATQAWLELEYNRKVHSELGQTPLQRYLSVKNVGRPCPDAETLRQAFTVNVSRLQRRSDGTVTIDGVRFEVPSQYRHLKRIVARYASWDMSKVYQADPHSGQIIGRLYPLDKHRNADGLRRSKAPIAGAAPAAPEPTEPSDGMAPLLRKLMAEYAATGLPPAYLPKDEEASSQENPS
jgi:transposase InsO family protein